MKELELRKLNRAELLELLIAQMKENERLSGENEALRSRLEDRRIELEEAGSIAEAALRLNGVFAAAEAAAAQYLENVRRMAGNEAGEAGAVPEARKKAEQILAEAEKDARRIRDEALFSWDIMNGR